MFVAAVFIVAKTWKQPACPRTEEWIKKTQCTDNTEMLLNCTIEIRPCAATRMQRDVNYHTQGDKLLHTG